MRTTLQSGARRSARALCVGLALTGSVACGSADAVSAPPIDKDQLYYQLTIDRRAILLSTHSPWDTVRITATARTASGKLLPNAPHATFTTTNESVSVDSAGLLTVLAAKEQIFVIASLTYQGITHYDTAVVSILETTAPPTLDSFSITPEPPDSTKMAMARFFGDPRKQLPIRIFDTNGDSIRGAVVDFVSSNPAVASVDRTGLVSLKQEQPGTVTIYASTTVYGITKRDSVVLQITEPLNAWMNVGQRRLINQPPVTLFIPDSITVGVGATVIWSTYIQDSVAVIFEDPSSLQEAPAFPTGSGNVPACTSCDNARLFTRTGTFRYRDPKSGARGVVVVR